MIITLDQISGQKWTAYVCNLHAMLCFDKTSSVAVKFIALAEYEIFIFVFALTFCRSKKCMIDHKIPWMIVSPTETISHIHVLIAGISWNNQRLAWGTGYLIRKKQNCVQLQSSMYRYSCLLQDARYSLQHRISPCFFFFFPIDLSTCRNLTLHCSTVYCVCLMFSVL